MAAVGLLCRSGVLNSILSDYEVLPLSKLQLHSVRKRDVNTQSHLERLVSFRALQRYGNIWSPESQNLKSRRGAVCLVTPPF